MLNYFKDDEAQKIKLEKIEDDNVGSENKKPWYKKFAEGVVELLKPIFRFISLPVVWLLKLANKFFSAVYTPFSYLNDANGKEGSIASRLQRAIAYGVLILIGTSSMFLLDSHQWIHVPILDVKVSSYLLGAITFLIPVIITFNLVRDKFSSEINRLKESMPSEEKIEKDRKKRVKELNAQVETDRYKTMRVMVAFAYTGFLSSLAITLYLVSEMAVGGTYGFFDVMCGLFMIFTFLFSMQANRDYITDLEGRLDTKMSPALSMVIIATSIFYNLGGVKYISNFLSNYIKQTIWLALLVFGVYSVVAENFMYTTEIAEGSNIGIAHVYFIVLFATYYRNKIVNGFAKMWNAFKGLMGKLLNLFKTDKQ
ncbi:hypothetical protein ACMXYX_18200 (plasmid) [Neptuniibacter sp. QD72_48]|uniref:hypothetical protein n=1 Tax=Neptuniibacter sp. QD72_48 TaxID=3398214 RepID=UPI0039F5A0E7